MLDGQMRRGSRWLCQIVCASEENEERRIKSRRRQRDPVKVQFGVTWGIPSGGVQILIKVEIR